MLDINPDGKKMILSLDGGGMRGIVTVAMLAELERLTEKPAYELFDVVAGTSSGAIIAAGLCLHMTAQEILDSLFKVTLPKVFVPRNLVFWLRYLLTGLRHMYETKAVTDALVPLAQGKKIRDLQDPIIFLTTKDLRTSNTYYVVSAGPGAVAFGDWPLAGAVAASTSAPGLFEPIGGNLVDGAVGVYNNPSLAAAVEAVEYLGFAADNTRMVSLGVGYYPNTVADGGGARFWAKDWLEYVVVEGFDDATLQQTSVTRKMYPALDLRRYNPLMTKASVEDKLGVSTGKLDPARLSVDAASPDELALLEKIGRAYGALLDWTQPNVSPWDTIGGHAQPGILPVDWSKTPFG